MPEKKQEIQSGSIFSTLRSALQSELDQLKATRQEITLFAGTFVGAFADHFYYRFEIPEDLFLRTIESATFAVGKSQPIVVAGKIIAVDNQFLTIALPIDFGPVLPETKCTWSYQENLQPVIEMLPADAGVSSMADLLLQPSDKANKHVASFEPQFLPQTPAPQSSAIHKILLNKISVL